MSLVLVAPDVVLGERFADESAIYGVDFAGRLAPLDTVSSGMASAMGDGITVGNAVVSGSIVKARISGAAPGTTIGVKFECTTAAGDTFERPIYFKTIA